MPISADRLVGNPSSLAWKAPCRVCAASPITLSGLQTVDGVALADGDRVLVTAQTNTVQNGIYVARTSAWERGLDADGARDLVRGTLVRVTSGTLGNGWYEVTTSDPVIAGTSALTFQRWVLA